MKKKICVALGIIATIFPIIMFCFTLFAVASIKVTPITADDYIKVMTSNGIATQDITSALSAQEKSVTSRYIRSNIGIFEECKSAGTAANDFQILNNSLITQYREKGVNVFRNVSEISGTNFQYKSYGASEEYVTTIQVDNTLFALIVKAEHKDFGDKIIKELGYDITSHFNAKILVAPTLTEGALIVALLLFYTALIFKNNKVNPILAIVPFANSYFLCKIADKNGWKMLFFFIPFFNFVYYFILMYKLAKKYTDSETICYGMGFLPLVLLPIIAFDEPKIEEKPKNVYEEILKEDGIE